MEETKKFNTLKSADITNGIQLGKFTLCNRPGQSKVWLKFDRILTHNGAEIKDFVVCKSCGKVLKVYKKSTTNLRKHTCYKKYLSLENDNDDSMVEVKTSPIEFIGNPIDDLTKLLTRWIIKDCRPYDLIQNEVLQDIFQEAARIGNKFGDDVDIGSFLPTMSEIEQNVSVIYEHCFGNVKAEIASIKDNGFSLTTDTWTDNVTRQNYIALTIHYLKNEELRFHFLGLHTIEDENNSKQNIVSKVKQILETFDCELSSTSIIVTAGDADIFKSIPDATHLPCISQLLDSAFLKSVAEVAEVVEIVGRCSKLVSFLKKRGLNNLMGLQSFYPNRWISIFKMINCIENNWNEIEKTLHSRIEARKISDINRHHLRALTKTFQPFVEAIQTLEDDSYATIHLVLVYFHDLKKSCNTTDSEFKDFEYIESLKERLLFNMEQIITENITNLHKLALFLYPPTNKLLQFSDEEKQSIESECARLMQCFKDNSKPKIKQEPDLSTSDSKRRKLFSDFIESQANCDPNELILQEIQYYKNSRVVNRPDFDLFGWWELQKYNFPILYKLSCNILATPATSAASKRIFPAARSLLCEKSYQGTKETEAEKIMFINSNAELIKLESYLST